MIWILLFVLSIIFFKLGIWYTLFVITATALKVSLLVIFILAGLLSWRWWRDRKKYIQWRKI